MAEERCNKTTCHPCVLGFALVGWPNSDEANALMPVLHEGIAHYECVRIRSFVDGNGRTAVP